MSEKLLTLQQYSHLLDALSMLGNRKSRIKLTMSKITGGLRAMGFTTVKQAADVYELIAKSERAFKAAAARARTLDR